MVFEVAEGGSESSSFVKSVLVDAEHDRALEADAFGGLAFSELGVDAADGSGADGLDFGQG